MLVLSKDYAIGGDELNVILYQRRVTTRGKTPGKESWRAIRYYANCENALKDVVNLKINSTGLTELGTIVVEIQDLKAMIDRSNDRVFAARSLPRESRPCMRTTSP